MKVKQKMKKFFTLQHRANDGFTLVELVVVIAILAILAGVGSAGYAGYIKSANKKTDKTTVLNVIRALDTANYSGMIEFEVEGQYADGMQIPVGYVVISNEPLASTGTYTAVVSQGVVTDDGNGNYSTSGTGVDELSNPVAAALSNAYGHSYGTAVKLNSDNWKADATATFYASAGTMIETVDTMGTNVLWLMENLGANNGEISLGGKKVNVFSQDYENSAELMQVFATKVSEVDKETFLNSWENVNDEGAAFGLNSAGREHYSAARAAYNSCFATYVAENTNGTSTVLSDGTTVTHTGTNCSSKITNYGKDAGQTIIDAANLSGLAAIGAWATVNGALALMDKEVSFPQSVCADTFATGGGLACPACAALYQQYKDEGIDRVNGEAFYDTMKTGAVEGGEILGDNAQNKDAYFNWVEANAQSFADMSADVNALVGDNSAVIIQVYSKNGVLEYAVSPKSILD